MCDVLLLRMCARPSTAKRDAAFSNVEDRNRLATEILRLKFASCSMLPIGVKRAI